MTERVAEPGDLTCVNDDCDRSGLWAAGRDDCQLCHGPLYRVPEEDAATRSSTTAAAPAGTGWRDKPVAVRLAIAVPIAIGITLVLFVIRNPDVIHRLTGPEYQVGDCVHVLPGLGDERMTRTTCTPNRITTDVYDTVYQVDNVKPGKSASCPGGFDRVTFSNEPEDTTYCLKLYGFR